MSKFGSSCTRKRKINDAFQTNQNIVVATVKDCKKEVGVEENIDSLEVRVDNESRKPLRSFRRAWKYKIADDNLTDNVINDEMERCSYVSGRTQIACTNVRLKSELDSNGFCEVHTRFFRQLKQLFIAEQRRSDPGLFTAKILDEDGSVLVSDDDETLATSSEWPASCEDFHSGFFENDDCHPLQRAGIISEEECLLVKLELLERKKRTLQNYRELLVEKARRRAAFYKRKVTEEMKRGTFIATTRKEKAIMQSYRALKSYRRWMLSSLSQNMKKKNDLRLQLTDDAIDKFAYLKLASANGSTKACAYSKHESANEEVSERTGRILSDPSVRLHCSEPVLPGSSYCLKHISEDKNQKLFSVCPSCSALVHDVDAVLWFGKKEVNVQFGKECSSCMKLQKSLDGSPSVQSHESLLGDENQVKPVISGANVIKGVPTAYGENAVSSSELGILAETVSRKRRYDDDEISDANVKYVVIASSDEDGEDVFKLPGEPTGNRPRFVPGIAPQFSTRNRPFNDSKLYPESNVKLATDPSHPISSSIFPLQKKRMKDTYTCARVRPFQRTTFFDEKERKRRKTNYQAATSERYYTSGQFETQKKFSNGSVSSIRPSSSAVQTLIHHIRTGGPKKVASALHILQASPSLVPQRINSGPGRASISANSNLQPPKLSRIATNNSKVRQSPSYGLLMDPSTISLGPSPSRESSQHPSTSYSPHTGQRSDVQPNTIELRRRNSNNLTSAYVRSVNATPNDEGRRYTYKPYSLDGTPRIVPGYRPRTSIIVSGSNSVPPFRALSQDKYAESRTVERQSAGEHYFRRVERSYPSSQSVRSRLTFGDPARNVYHNSSYSPYQGNSITGRMREIPRPSELRHFPKYESYVDPFATDSRVPRNAVDSEAAAAVASIVNERSDADDVEAPEINEKSDCDFASTCSVTHDQAFSAEIITSEKLTDSLQLTKNENVASGQAPSNTHLDDQALKDVTGHSKYLCDDAAVTSKLDIQDRHEDGLAVLALAAESHAAVRCRVTEASNDAQSTLTEEQEGSEVLHCVKKATENQSDTISNSQSKSVAGSRISAPYQILGFEEEDEDDY